MNTGNRDLSITADSNSDKTLGIYLKTTGELGIGTASPGAKLHVDVGAPSSSDQTLARFQSQDSRQIGFVWDDSASTLGIATLTNHPIAFHTNGNSSEKMRITTEGYVIKPNQPAFDVARPGNTSGTHTGWVNTWVNQGNHFNASNGRFTAPVAGLYMFYFTGIKNDLSTTTVRLYLLKNGSQLHGNRHLRLDGGGSNPYGDNGTMQWQVALSSGDYVQAATNAGAVYIATSEYTVFGGYLIG